MRKLWKPAKRLILPRRKFLAGAAAVIAMPYVARAQMGVPGGASFNLQGSVSGASNGLLNNLSAYWKCDEGTGTTTADASGNGNTGTLSGSTIPTWTTSGKINDALSYNGTTAYVNVPDNAVLDTGAISVSSWVNYNAFTNAYNTIVHKGSGLAFYECYVKSSGQLAMYLNTGATVSYDGTGSHTLSTGTWYHVVLTYDATQGLIGYVNGASDGSATPAGAMITTAGYPLTIGTDLITAGRYSNATIDEVGVWSRALSSANVSALYNSGSGLPYSSFTT